MIYLFTGQNLIDKGSFPNEHRGSAGKTLNFNRFSPDEKMPIQVHGEP